MLECKKEPVIIDYDIYNVFGKGIESTWQAVLNQKTNYRECNRFTREHYRKKLAAIAPGTENIPTKDIPELFLNYLHPSALKMPESTEIFLASTVGIIDEWNNPEHRCTSNLLLEHVLNVFQKKRGRVVSAACASVNTSFSILNHLIRSGRVDSAIVVGIDYVSEFVFSGFSVLRAMAESAPSPYDSQRDGLLLGDSAGLIAVSSREFANEHHKKIFGKILGTGLTCDAYHITAPMPNGEMLAQAIQNAMDSANITPEEIGAVIGHGTGTIYNDAMEINALHHFYGNEGVPLLSVKANAGHTLAGAGLLQISIALKILETEIIPGQTGLSHPAPGAENYVSKIPKKLKKKKIMCMNSGFGGVNAVVILGL